jgi:activator of 2-hydroxyglutaryl-CoA dehydratase
MRFAGIDIGSRTIELVVVDEAGQIKASLQADTGFDPITEAKKMVGGVSFDKIMAKGNNRREIARGLHASVIRRAAGMIKRVSSEGDIVFTGGVAKNPCMVAFLAEKLEREVLIPENPQFIGALGAALLVADMN